MNHNYFPWVWYTPAFFFSFQPEEQEMSVFDPYLTKRPSCYSSTWVRKLCVSMRYTPALTPLIFWLLSPIPIWRLGSWDLETNFIDLSQLLSNHWFLLSEMPHLLNTRKVKNNLHYFNCDGEKSFQIKIKLKH